MSERRSVPYRMPFFIAAGLLVLLIGAVIGAVVSGVRLGKQAREAGLPAGGAGRGVQVMVDALPPEQGAQMRETFRQAWREAGDLRREQGQARRDAARVLSAETYDEAAALAALERIREADTAAAQRVNVAMARALGMLGVEDRRTALRAWVRARFAPGARDRAIRDGARGPRGEAPATGEGPPVRDPAEAPPPPPPP